MIQLTIFLFTVLEGVTQTLEQEIDTTPDAAELAKLIQDKISSVKNKIFFLHY